MKILLIQAPLVWENPNANRAYFENKIRAVSETVDLVILPEMFTTGFTMNPEHVAEKMNGETVSWLKTLAQEQDFALTGSIVVTENGHFYNRLLFVLPSGEVKHYDKRHLFSLAGEDQVYTAGEEKLIVEYKGWKICPLICYDLRFPVFSRNAEAYDLLIYVANWPEVRVHAWDSLIKARAIENMSYAIGVNRVGEDHNRHLYNGYSQVVDYMGNYVIKPSINEAVFIAELSRDEMLEARLKFGFLNDRDNFTVN